MKTAGVTQREMRNIELQAEREYRVPPALLMEHAGRSIAERLRSFVGGDEVVFVCGPGQNGGDGLCAARHLEQLRGNIRVVMPDGFAPRSPECRQQWSLLQKLPVRLYTYSRWLAIPESRTRNSWWVDALFGIGLNRPLTGVYADLVFRLNQHPCRRVIAVDLPSGLDADTGLAGGPFVRAGRTLVLGRMKRGLRAAGASEYVGRCEVLYAGFPQWRHESLESAV